MAYLTFPQFQASRIEVASIPKALHFDDGADYAGFVYSGGGWIAKQDDGYYTVVERMDWIDDSLDKVELILWTEFYLSTQDNVLLATDDGTLDEYVRGYFTARNKPDFDGGLMGDLFSERDLWTLKEAEDVCYSALNFERHWDEEQAKGAADIIETITGIKRKVVIEVRGGIAECKSRPADTEVVIIDHDEHELELLERVTQ